jgi:hypothetical protein
VNRVRFLVLLSVFWGWSGTEEASVIEIPRYQLLYEEGFYTEAIAVLDSLITEDAVFSPEHHYALAACYIARGDRDSGATVFERMFNSDSTYLLDTLLTPPKIRAVFLDVQRRRTAQRSDSVVATAEKKSTQYLVGMDVADNTLTSADTLTVKVAPPFFQRIAGVFPCGIGAFYQRKPVHGVLIALTQLGAVAGCVWAYQTREKLYHERYGWYHGNKEVYNRYTNYTRGGAGIFIGSYAFGILDYYLTMHRRRVQRSKQ